MKDPDIREIKEQKLIGMRVRTSLSNDETRKLWQRFKPRVHEVSHRVNRDFYSVQVYDHIFEMKDFTPKTEFDKWAAVEVSDIENIPQGMEVHHLSGGKYAVFIHKGPVNTFHKSLQYIYSSWLPGSGYSLDNREHFEILGDAYLGPDNPKSKEQVWIPVRQKSNW